MIAVMVLVLLTTVDEPIGEVTRSITIRIRGCILSKRLETRQSQSGFHQNDVAVGCGHECSKDCPG